MLWAATALYCDDTIKTLRILLLGEMQGSKTSGKFVCAYVAFLRAFVHPFQLLLLSINLKQRRG